MNRTPRESRKKNAAAIEMFLFCLKTKEIKVDGLHKRVAKSLKENKTKSQDTEAFINTHVEKLPKKALCEEFQGNQNTNVHTMIRSE